MKYTSSIVTTVRKFTMIGDFFKMESSFIVTALHDFHLLIVMIGTITSSVACISQVDNCKASYFAKQNIIG